MISLGFDLKTVPMYYKLSGQNVLGPSSQRPEGDATDRLFYLLDLLHLVIIILVTGLAAHKLEPQFSPFASENGYVFCRSPRSQ